MIQDIEESALMKQKVGYACAKVWDALGVCFSDLFTHLVHQVLGPTPIGLFLFNLSSCIPSESPNLTDLTQVQHMELALAALIASSTKPNGLPNLSIQNTATLYQVPRSTLLTNGMILLLRKKATHMNSYLLLHRKRCWLTGSRWWGVEAFLWLLLWLWIMLLTSLVMLLVSHGSGASKLTTLSWRSSGFRH